MLPWLLAASLLNGADAASTQWNLAHHGGEHNPILGRHPSPVAVWALAGAATTGEWIAAKRWEKDHPTLVKTLLITMTAAKGVAVAHNVYYAVHPVVVRK